MNTIGFSNNTDNGSDTTDTPDRVVRQVIDLAVAVAGAKRGLFRAAELIGATERWVKSLRFGEPARISAQTYLRALEARQALAAERAAQLRAELVSLEKLSRNVLNESARGLASAATGGGATVDRRSVARRGAEAHGAC
jgi:hypothetical protein